MEFSWRASNAHIFTDFLQVFFEDFCYYRLVAVSALLILFFSSKNCCEYCANLLMISHQHDCVMCIAYRSAPTSKCQVQRTLCALFVCLQKFNKRRKKYTIRSRKRLIQPAFVEANAKIRFYFSSARVFFCSRQKEIWILLSNPWKLRHSDFIIWLFDCCVELVHETLVMWLSWNLCRRLSTVVWNVCVCFFYVDLFAHIIKSNAPERQHSIHQFALCVLFAKSRLNIFYFIRFFAVY